MRILLGVSDEIEPEECYRHWFKNIEPDYVEMVQEAVQEILETGRSEVLRHRHSCAVQLAELKNVVDQRQQVFRGDTDLLPALAMVAKRKQEQAIMELLEKVRRANSAKSEFLSYMSHDLRTPITRCPRS